MNIITRNNQKTLIFLKKEADLVLASIVLLTYEASGKVTRSLVGTKKITDDQLADLYAQKSDLSKKDIYIIDVAEEPVSTAALLGDLSNTFDVINEKPSVVSFFQSIFDEVNFLSTQKTRGPNN